MNYQDKYFGLQIGFMKSTFGLGFIVDVSSQNYVWVSFHITGLTIAIRLGKSDEP